ncbi:MAG: PilT/PilU family type 4a pilus ATPase [Planctomycetota bacterium]
MVEAVSTSASDVHLSVGARPYFRRFGSLGPSSAYDELSSSDLAAIVRFLLSDAQLATYERDRTVDLAYRLEEPRGRYRINVFFERGQHAISIRRLDDEFRTIEELNLPEQMHELSKLRDGLVLVTGPTGSGKTTTLATVLHQINAARSEHIITIEDPIEYEHRNIRSLVRQRELHSDVTSFASAVRAALREDPDVLLVGEMRDVETARAAITAAETGHLVFSTLHTGDTVGAVSRLLGVFPADEQDAVRHELSLVLRAVVAQRLIEAVDGEGRYPAVEILMVTNAVANLIRIQKFEQLYSALEAGRTHGMQTFDQSLAELVSRGRVSDEVGLRNCRDEPSYLACLLAEGGTVRQSQGRADRRERRASRRER